MSHADTRNDREKPMKRMRDRRKGKIRRGKNEKKRGNVIRQAKKRKIEEE